MSCLRILRRFGKPGNFLPYEQKIHIQLASLRPPCSVGETSGKKQRELKGLQITFWLNSWAGRKGGFAPQKFDDHHFVDLVSYYILIVNEQPWGKSPSPKEKTSGCHKSPFSCFTYIYLFKNAMSHHDRHHFRVTPQFSPSSLTSREPSQATGTSMLCWSSQTFASEYPTVNQHRCGKTWGNHWFSASM